jgi:hypothetical protein
MRNRTIGILSALAVVAVVLGLAPSAMASITVKCDTQSLQQKITNAPPGSTLLVEGHCVGTFHVAKNLTLTGNPHATLDAGGQGRTLTINDAPIVLLKGLTITGGQATLGGGIYHAAGPLRLERVTVTENTACCAASVDGGGIYSAGGTLTLLSSSIVGNQAQPLNDDTTTVAVRGGGIFNHGRLRIDHSHITSNTAQADASNHNGSSAGGGIYSEAGLVTLLESPVVGNRAMSNTGGFAGAAAQGGGVFSHGPLELQNSRVGMNVARAGAGGGGGAQGGGVFAESSLGISSSLVDGNRAILTPTYAGGGAAGGGVLDAAPDEIVTITASTFHGNIARASATFTPVADGGALTADSKSVTITSTTFSGNVAHATALSGDGTPVAAGGSVNVTTADHAAMSNVRILDSEAIADGGPPTAIGGGVAASGPLSLVSSAIRRNAVSAPNDTTFGPSVAQGGGLDNATGATTLVRTTISANRVTAAADGDNASATGGGVSAGKGLAARASTFSANSVTATAPGHQAQATGGGLSIAAATQVVNSTLAGNSVDASATGSGGSAIGYGGGIYANGGDSHVVNSTVARNTATVDGASADGRGGGVYREFGTLTLEATITGLNEAPSGQNCYGTVFSDGYNLMGHLGACAFNPKPTDLLNKAPILGQLTNNGGPTNTIKPLSGSPALNRIPAASCAVRRDQRGVKRPQGLRCDIGSLERKI